MYEFWYDYIKPNYQNNGKLCYMGTDSFIINIKTEDVLILYSKKAFIEFISDRNKENKSKNE